MSRCTGHCCDPVYLCDAQLDVMTAPEDAGIDAEYIRNMLVFQEWTKSGAVFSCRHFNGTDCTAYDQRPHMCSAYPYDKPCTQEGCTRSQS